MVKKKIEVKKWYESKTLWINVLVIGGGVASILAGEVQAGATITFAGVVNAVLRVISKHKIVF